MRITWRRAREEITTSGRWRVAAISGGKMSASSRSKRKTQSEAQRGASELKRGRRERSDEWGQKDAACSGTRRIKGASDERASLPTWSQNFSRSTEQISKKGIKLILKTIGNRKGDCAWSFSRWQTQPEKICKLQSTTQYNMRSEWHWFVRCDLQIFSGCVCHLEQLRAQSPFLFPVVFRINGLSVDLLFGIRKADGTSKYGVQQREWKTAVNPAMPITVG